MIVSQDQEQFATIKITCNIIKMVGDGIVQPDSGCLNIVFQGIGFQPAQLSK